MRGYECVSASVWIVWWDDVYTKRVPIEVRMSAIGRTARHSASSFVVFVCSFSNGNHLFFFGWWVRAEGEQKERGVRMRAWMSLKSQLSEGRKGQS